MPKNDGMTRKERKRRRKHKGVSRKPPQKKVYTGAYVDQSKLPVPVEIWSAAMTEFDSMFLDCELDPEECDCEKLIALVYQARELFEEYGIDLREPVSEKAENKICGNSKGAAWYRTLRLRCILISDSIDIVERAAKKSEKSGVAVPGKEVVCRLALFLLLGCRAKCEDCFKTFKGKCPTCGSRL